MTEQGNTPNVPVWGMVGNSSLIHEVNPNEEFREWSHVRNIPMINLDGSLKDPERTESG